MTYVFISDLHLSPDYPQLIQGFIDLLAEYQNKNTQLYILGDWFNAWLGDDDSSLWLDDLVQQLQKFSQAGNQIYFLAGNRDFALGQGFLDRFNAILLPDIAYITLGNYKIRLEHGDLLCTDDVSYQRFRKVIRNPVLLRLLKSTPLSFRQKLAMRFRAKSQSVNQIKSYTVMDVNLQAVEQALNDIHILIHGHTHRPNKHYHLLHKQRIVLGDWRESEAKILVLDLNQLSDLELSTWHYPTANSINAY